MGLINRGYMQMRVDFGEGLHSLAKVTGEFKQRGSPGNTAMGNVLKE